MESSELDLSQCEIEKLTIKDMKEELVDGGVTWDKRMKHKAEFVEAVFDLRAQKIEEVADAECRVNEMEEAEALEEEEARSAEEVRQVMRSFLLAGVSW